VNVAGNSEEIYQDNMPVSGGLTIGGQSLDNIVDNFVSSGGVSVYAYTTELSDISASGGSEVSGSSLYQISLIIPLIYGGSNIGGNADVVYGQNYVALGGSEISGTAEDNAEYSVASSGGSSLAGESLIVQLTAGQLYFDGMEQDLEVANGQLYFDGMEQDLEVANGQLYFDGMEQDLEVANGQLYFDGTTQDLGKTYGALLGGESFVIRITTSNLTNTYTYGLNSDDALGETITPRQEGTTGVAISYGNVFCYNTQSTQGAIASGNGSEIRIENQGSTTYISQPFGPSGTTLWHYRISSVSIDSTGDNIAIGNGGMPLEDNILNVIKTYHNYGSSWTQYGGDITTGSPESNFGVSFDLNASGDALVASNFNMFNDGDLYLYVYDGNNWNYSNTIASGLSGCQWFLAKGFTTLSRTRLVYVEDYSYPSVIYFHTSTGSITSIIPVETGSPSSRIQGISADRSGYTVCFWNNEYFTIYSYDGESNQYEKEFEYSIGNFNTNYSGYQDNFKMSGDGKTVVCQHGSASTNLVITIFSKVNGSWDIIDQYTIPSIKDFSEHFDLNIDGTMFIHQLAGDYNSLSKNGRILKRNI
jgi:hypothetical protein